MTEGAATRKRSFWRFCFKIAFSFFVLAVLCCFACGVAIFIALDRVTRPGVPGEPIDIMIPAGATGQDTAAILTEKGLIEHPIFLRLAIRLDKSGGAIKHGPYVLHKGLSPAEILRMLEEGPNRTPDAGEIPPDRKVTVPEGLTIAQAAKLFDAPSAFIEAAADPDLIARMGIEAPTLEGFLMPNTYFFDRKPSEREVVERMVSEFLATYARLAAEFPGAAQRTVVEVVTVASLIEEEARLDDERPQVAAVVYNRMEKKMPLQLDSTLQYALGKYGERLLYEDREVNSPYNTYLHPGLPPGPISSPGEASLRAALQPTPEAYLYFVSNADGMSHTFSKTESEHVRAVERFRREIAPQRRAVEP